MGMKKRYSILHISDLHKPENCNLDNLLYSLQRDCEDYKKEEICKPEIIVVSGDLAEGTKECGEAAETIIKGQYAEVKTFLERLTDYFLDGQKKRMVIVPGNHDYCYKVSKDSMELSPVENEKDDCQRMKIADPNVRWNWVDKRFYHITKETYYNTRFELFREFYNEFFAGIRKLPENLERDSYIVELNDYNIAFVCFNSCHRLDHLNPMGCICPDAVTRAHGQLLKLKNMGYLLVGVWHHHVSGLPIENNYMDHRILNAMMQEDIKIGLFGHQHVSTAVQEYSDITSQQRILLISSGSLYGNRHQLVTGVPRQYNIIGVDMADEEVTVRLNVRKDNSQYGYDIPQWIQSPVGMRNLPFFEHKLRIEKPKIEYVLEDIERTVQVTNNYELACMRLREAGLENDLVLKYFDNYVSKVNDKELLRYLLAKPMTKTQFMTALDAAVDKKDKEWIQSLLDYKEYQADASAYVRELLVKAEKMI